MTVPKKRRELFRAGRRGDMVRVVVDTKEDRSIVYYRDADGIEHKAKYANTKEGRAEAVAFAEGWHSERARMEQQRREAAKPAPISVRELWTAFKDAEFSSEVGEGLRKATQISYAHHFKRFELYVGKDRAAETIKVPELAAMRKIERAAGRALNQTRQTMNVVRIVFRWGIEHELLTHSPLAVMRWKSRKDAPAPLAPDEYVTAEFEKLLGAVDKDDTRQWRAWVFLMLVGHYGMRANAVLHLRWRDIDVEADTITWPARYQKQGKDLVRPLTWEGWSALLVAKAQRERVATFRKLSHHTNEKAGVDRLEEADWVLFAERDKAQPMSYQSMHYHLTQAEIRGKVEPKPYRKAHGFRRMVVGNVIEATGDRMLGLEVVGDKDPKVLMSYDKRLKDRIEQGMAAVATTGGSDGTEATAPHKASRKRPDVPKTATAPAGAGAVSTETINS
jgi:integrase